MPITPPVAQQEISASAWGIPITDEVNRITPITTTTPWVNCTLLNGWAAFANYRTPRYRKIGDIVYLEGYCIPGTTVVICTLPVGFRPLSNLEMAAAAYGASRIVQSITVFSNGNVQSDTLVNVGFSFHWSIT